MKEESSEAPAQNGTDAPATAAPVAPDAEAADPQPQEAIATAASGTAESQSLAPIIAGLLSGVNDKLAGLEGTFEKLSNQLASLSEEQNKKIGELDKKLYLICDRYNIRAPRPQVEKTTTTVTPPSAPNSAEPKTGGPKSHYGLIGQLASKYPDMCAISGKNPLTPGYEFRFKVGDYTFGSMEQALYYITFMHMKKPDLALKAMCARSVFGLSQIITAKIQEEIEKDPENLEAMKDIATTLFLLRLKQSKDFEEKIQSDEVGNFKSFLFAHGNMLLGTGCNLEALVKSLPDGYKGKNLYGIWLKEFVEAHRLGFPGGGEPFDVKKHCTFETVPLSEEKDEVLVLGDVQLHDFNGKFGTKLVVRHTMGLLENPKATSHTAKKIIEDLENGLEPYAAVVLLFGTYEVGKSPDKLESDYTAFLKYIREKAPHAAIFVGTALPRYDKLQEHVKLTNYAIGIATRNMDDPRVVLLDVYAKFMALPACKPFILPNGFQLNEGGARKLGNILAEMVPFVNLVIPNPEPPSKKQRPAFPKSSPRGAGGPPAKRGRTFRSYASRGGSVFPRGGGAYSSGSYNGTGVAVSAGYYNGPSPWAGTAGMGSVSMTPGMQQASYGGATSYDYLSRSGKPDY